MVNSLLLTNHELPNSSEFFHQGRGRHQPPGKLHVWAFYPYLSLGFYFHHDNMALEDVGHFLQELPKQLLKDAKPAQWQCPLPGGTEVDVMKLPWP